MSSKKEPKPVRPTLQVRVYLAGELVGEAQVPGGLHAMKGAN